MGFAKCVNCGIMIDYSEYRMRPYPDHHGWLCHECSEALMSVIDDWLESGGNG